MGILNLLIDHVRYRKREEKEAKLKAEMEAKQAKRESKMTVNPINMSQFGSALHKALTTPKPPKAAN